MSARAIGEFTVQAIGLGCMGLSHGYGPAASESQATALLLDAVDQGVDFFDTAALYGNGANEALVGRVLAPHRQRLVLASTSGLNHPDSGLARRIDGRPETIRASCEASLTRLGTDVIEYFKALARETGVPYQNLINLYLSECAHSGKKLALKWAS
jgi:aryl-alcohol dehydrogenase-like predicted oxidoreductase